MGKEGKKENIKGANNVNDVQQLVPLMVDLSSFLAQTFDTDAKKASPSGVTKATLLSPRANWQISRGRRSDHEHHLSTGEDSCQMHIYQNTCDAM